MNKSLRLFSILCFLFCTLSAQDTWELSNPKPSYKTGLDIHFISNLEGFVINNSELLYTLDRGNNWLKKMSINSGNDINFLSTTGYIVGNFGYVLKSSDGGVTWEQINVNSNQNFNTVHILDQNVVIISGENGITKSLDGGNTWQNIGIDNYTANKTFFTSSLVGHAVCNGGTILKTIDGGENWYITESINTFPNDFFTVYFINESIGFATREHNDVLKTIDGGETWSEISGISDAIYSFFFIDENIGYASGDHGVIFKTIDGGNTWEWAGFQNGRYGFTDILGIYFLDSNIGFAVGQRGRIIKTEDGGNTWSDYAPFYNDVNQLQFVSDMIGYASVGDSLFKTEDGGNTWVDLDGPIDYPGVVIRNFDFINENIGYANAGVSNYVNGVYKTIDGGINWVQTNNGNDVTNESLYAIDFVNENLGFVSGGFNQDFVKKTTDGGNTWEQVESISFGQIQFLNAQVGYARRVGNAFHRVYKTVDSGETWNTVFEIEEDITNFHFLDENNGFFIGDNALMYKTVDGGNSWKELDIPYEYYDLVKFYSPNVGYICDEEGQVYKTMNGGLSWEQVIRLYGTKTIAITDNDNIFLSGTYGKIIKSSVTYDPIVLKANPAEGVSNSTAILSGNVTSNSGVIENIRFEYGTNYFFDNVVELSPNTVNPNESRNISVDISNLDSNSMYQYRIKVTYNNVEYTSDIVEFNTLQDYEIDINNIYMFSATTAEVSGRIISNQADLTDIEFQYGTEENSFEYTTNATPAIVVGNTSEMIEANLSQLESETTYYVRIKAIHNNIEVYSQTISFTTRPEYTINLYNPSINQNSATLSAFISAYKEDITNIVFEYGSSNYENNIGVEPNTINVNTSNSVSALLTDLDPSVVYYYRVKALQGSTYIYSDEGVFNTSGEVIIVSGNINQIEDHSIILKGLINPNGKYLSNIEFEYGITDLYGSLVQGTPNIAYGYGTNNITAIIENLELNTVYHYRIKALEGENVYYSQDYQFNSNILGIDQINNTQNKISIYPNPTSDQIVNINYDGTKSIKQILLLDVSGRTLLNLASNDNEGVFKIDLLNTPKGLYLINLIFDDNTLITKKIILK